MSCLFINLE